ncbi:MAG: restriction endonuclease [Oscillospiraceae bacterium]|jgi:CheY-like chemotaxis protein|nr:restriction endonuclease [Oscillospiraceae bacterium]
MKILILDDDIQLLTHLSEFLKHEGHEVISCLTIDSANHEYLSNKDNLDLIISGLNMPFIGLKDSEVAETEGGLFAGWVWLKNYVLNQNKDISIIIFSGFAIHFRQNIFRGKEIYTNNITILDKSNANIIDELKKEILQTTALKNSFVEESLIYIPVQNIAILRPEIIQDTIFVTKSSLSKIIAEPHLMHGLQPREFEELIAEIYRSLGYTVELTKQTRDGGKDLYIAHQNELGSFLYLVECKKYAVSNPVSVDTIRSVYGVLEMEKSTGGIICTTSRFSKDAIYEIELRNLRHRIELKDFEDIKELLRLIK